jgi:mono/diheme cytochrome c family protein
MWPPQTCPLLLRLVVVVGIAGIALAFVGCATTPRCHDEVCAPPCAEIVESSEGAATGQSEIATSSGAEAEQAASGDPSSGAEAGRNVFETAGCAACHIVAGKGGTIGPNLSNEGEKGHSRQWLLTQLKNPKEHNPTTVMPSFSSLGDQKLNDLVDYLSSLHGGRISAPAGPATPVAKKPPPVSQPGATAAVSRPTATTPPPAAVAATWRCRTGAQMWIDNCGRCHNYRPPSEYTDAQWAVVLHHMRLRVPLTGQQQRLILKYLQDSN